MIYAPGRFLFIHIPRTNGIAITSTVAVGTDWNKEYGLLISSGRYPIDLHRHARAFELHPHIPDWDVVRRAAVIRNPFRRAASIYRKMLTYNASSRWFKHASTTSFGQWVPEHLLKIGIRPNAGFWWFYCLGKHGEDLGVEAFRFEQLDVQWPRLAEILGLPGTAKSLHVNQAAESARAIEWTSDPVHFMRKHLIDDFTRFGYPKEP